MGCWNNWSTPAPPASMDFYPAKFLTRRNLRMTWFLLPTKVEAQPVGETRTVSRSHHSFYNFRDYTVFETIETLHEATIMTIFFENYFALFPPPCHSAGYFCCCAHRWARWHRPDIGNGLLVQVRQWRQANQAARQVEQVNFRATGSDATRQAGDTGKF